MGETLQLRKRADKSGDEPNFKKGESWPLAGVQLLADPPKTHSFSVEFVGRATAEGWMSIERGTIILHTDGSDVVYRIVRPPGQYNSDDKPATQEQIENKDFRYDNFFACELEEK